MSDGEASLPLIAVTASVGAIVLLFALLCNVFRRDKPEEEKENVKDKETTAVTGSEKGSANKKVKSSTKSTKKPAHVPFSHQWLSCTLKGHSSRIVSLDFSPNGKYLVTASEDRALMLWSVKEFRQKEHKYIRGNVEFDSATRIAFSPDSRALVGSLANENALRIFRLGKKDDGSHNVTITGALTFPSKHKQDIIGVGISSTGKWIMTCSGDTTILIWDLKGEILATIDTHQVNNSCGKVSPCGRFVASSGFTSDVKAWEVHFDKGGSFSKVVRAFELKGHLAGVYDFDFNNDSRRMASVSKDSTWKVWDTDVRYDMGQDPRLLYSGKVSHPGPALVALSPDGRTVAVGMDTRIAFCDAATGQQDEELENVHVESMSCLKFDISGRYLVCSGGKHVQVLHNVTGYKATVAELEEKLRTASGPGMKERIKQQVAEAKGALENILSPAKDSPK